MRPSRPPATPPHGAPGRRTSCALGSLSLFSAWTGGEPADRLRRVPRRSCMHVAHVEFQLKSREPPLFVIGKLRRKGGRADWLATYYILNGVIMQAPNFGKLLASRMVRCVAVHHRVHMSVERAKARRSDRHEGAGGRREDSEEQGGQSEGSAVTPWTCCPPRVAGQDSAPCALCCAAVAGGSCVRPTVWCGALRCCGAAI